MDLIRGACGGDLSPLASGAQIKRFERSINHPDIMGLEARHVVTNDEPPPNPMTSEKARDFAGRSRGNGLNNVARTCLREVVVTQEGPPLLQELAERGGAIAAMVEEWRNTEGDLVHAKVPLRGDIDDLELFACDLDSLAEELLQKVDGIIIGKRDSSELRQLLAWEDDLKSDLHDVYPVGETGQNLVTRLSELFTLLRCAIDELGDSLTGRRNFYVYAHKDKHGKLFYIGKGTSRRAWSRNRHPLWQKYVDQFDGEYQVEIIKDGLLEHEAERLEQQLIEQHSGELVNWFDAPLSQVIEASEDSISVRGLGDSAYLEALNRFHNSREETRDIVSRARLIEETDPAAAVALYRDALSKVCEYTKMCPMEPGLKGQLMGPWVPLGNDLAALDRLTLILERLGHADDIVREVDSFFGEFPGAEQGTVGDKINKRRERARSGKLRIKRRSAHGDEECN